MSNNSWKQYGGQSKMDNYNVINASTIVAEQFVSRSTKPIYQFLNGIFEVSMDLSAGINIIAGNSIYSNVDLFVNKDIYSNNKIYFGGNTFVNSYGNNPDYTFPTRANDSTHAYLYGDASFVGVNTVSPETNFHITATIPEHTDILTIENQNTYIRNIMAQNKNKKGMVMDTDDTSCNVHFFIDNSTNSLNNPNATIKCGENGALFTNSNIFQVDTSGGTIYMDTTRYTLDNSFSNINIDNATGDIQTDTSGQFIIHTSGGHFLLNEDKALLSSNGHIELHASGGYVEIDANGGEFVVNSGAFNLNSLFNFTPPLRGLSGELYNETITIYDNSNSTFLPNVYNINGLTTGNALVGVGKDPSSNTFMRLVPSTSLQGSAYGGGLYPYDWSRAMNLIGLNDICGNFVPNQTILEGNNKAKYVSTLGINTFMPKTEQYVVDMNGPLRIANGEINTVAEAHFEIKNMSFSKTHPNCGIAVGTPSTLFDDTDDATFKQNLLYTNNGGVSWNLSDIYQYNVSNDDFITTFNAVYMYDDKYGFFGGTGGFLFFTNDGGNSIYRILGGVSNDINCIVACKVDNDNIKLVIAHNDNKISYTNSIPKSGLDDPTPTQDGNKVYSTTIADNLPTLTNTITECHSNDNVIYFVGNGITKYTINTNTINEIANNNNNNYNNVFVLPNINTHSIAVGENIISYTTNGTSWSDININNQKITDVFMIDDKKNVIIGEDGYFAYTINGPAATENWITVPDSILNSSGMAQRITSNENNLKRLFMPDNNTLIIANVITESSNDTTDNSNDIVGYSKILYVFLPALFNRDNNTVLDICGNMMVSGNINSIDGRLYVGQTSTFNGDVLMNNNLVIENDATIKKRFFVHDFISQSEMVINSKFLTLNSAGVQSSEDSGIYIHDNNDSKAGHILVQDNMNGFKFKAPSVGSQSVCLETEQLKIIQNVPYDNNPYNIDLGINAVNNAIMTLNRRYDTTNINNTQTDASYSIAVSQFDISNVLVRDSNTSNDTIQDIKTKLIVQQDVSFNQNLYIGKDLIIDGNLSVQQYSNDTIIQTTSHNYDFLTVAEDMSLNGRFFVRDDVSMNSRLFVGANSIMVGDVSMNSRLFINGDVSMNSRLFINGDVSMNSRLFINGDVSLNSNLYTSGTVGIGIHNPFVSFDISKNDAIKIPKGTTGERPVANNADESHKGYIRYNTDINQFEGYGAGSNWSSLGGVTNVAKNTKIIAEDEPAATNNDLIFFTAEKDADEEGDKKERMRIDDSGNIGIHSDSPIVIFDISGTDALHIPKGQTGERPIKNTDGVFTDKNDVAITAEDMEKYQGCIRYNYDTSQFEGFGPGNNWGSLGGVINVAQNTKIIAEEGPAATNNDLIFYTAKKGSTIAEHEKERMRIDASGNIGIGYANPRCTLDISGVVNIGPTAPHENVLPWTMTMIDDREFVNSSNPKYNNNLLYIGKNSWFNSNGVNSSNVQNHENIKILLNNLKDGNTDDWDSHGKIAWVGGKHEQGTNRMINSNLSAWIDCKNNNNGDLKDHKGCIVFATNNTSNATERMRIDNEGNVGIGTNDPKANLHINHDFHIAANDSESNDNVGKGIYMRYSTNTNNTEDAAYIQSVDRTQNPDAYHPMYMQASHFYFNDEVDATSFNAVSDIRHKENICDLENALEKINTIRGVKFNFKDNDKIHAGIIAQEVAPIMPELINKDNDDKWSANYDGLIPYLIESVKTLTKDKKDMLHDIEELKRENEELKEKMTKYDLLFEQLLNK